MVRTGSVSAGAINVGVPGQFELDFAATSNWQPVRWFDLASSTTLDLANKGGVSLGYNVLQSSAEIQYNGAWYTLSGVQDPTITIVEENAARIVLRTTGHLRPVGSDFLVTTEYTILASGRVGVDMQLQNLSGASRTLSRIEYAFVNLEDALNWSITTQNNSHALTFRRTAGSSPYPNLLVVNSSPDTTIGNDATANRYWYVTNQTLAANTIFSRQWQLHLRPGSQTVSALSSRAADVLAPAVSNLSGGTITGSGYQSGQATYLVQASGSSVSLALTNAQTRYAPFFVINNWTSSSWQFSLNGTVQASNTQPVGTQAIGVYDSSGQRLVIQYLGTVATNATTAQRTFTITDGTPPTATATATASNTPLPSSTPSNTPTASNTSLPSNTPTPSNTPLPSNTPTNTIAPSNTPTVSNTSTPLPSNTPSNTLTPSNTPTFTPVGANTATPTASNTPIPTASNTPTATPTLQTAGGTSATLQLSGSASSGDITVSTSNEYSVNFSSTSGWQIDQWYDLASSSNSNLVREDGVSAHANVLQDPVEFLYDGIWYSLNDIEDASMTIVEQSAARVVLRTTGHLRPIGSDFLVTTQYTISPVGRIAVDMQLQNLSGASRTLNTIEYAFTNVKGILGWNISSQNSNHALAFLRTNGSVSFPNLLVVNSSADTAIDSDQLDGNRYWYVNNQTLAANGIFTRQWELQLRPGGQTTTTLSSRASDVRAPGLSGVSGGTITGTGYQSSAGAYAIQATGSSVSGALTNAQPRYNPAFVINNWTSSTWHVVVNGVIIASNSAPVSSRAIAHYNGATQQLVVQYVGTIATTDSTAQRTFTVEVP